MYEDLKLAAESEHAGERWVARLHRPERRQRIQSAAIWLPTVYFIVSGLRSFLAADWRLGLLQFAIAGLGALLIWERSGACRLVERYEARVGYLQEQLSAEGRASRTERGIAR